MDAEMPPTGNRKANVVRVPSDRIPQGSPVRSRDVQLWDNATESWKSVKRKAKGGKVTTSKPKTVKPKASRGDGIAQRGKTKGKLI